MRDLPSISFDPYILVIDPIGPIAGSPFATLDQALDAARGLERGGVRIESIMQGPEVFLEGSPLRAAIGEDAQPKFVNFPVSTLG